MRSRVHSLCSVDSIFASLKLFKFMCQSGAINSAAVEVTVTVHEIKGGETKRKKKREDFHFKR